MHKIKVTNSLGFKFFSVSLITCVLLYAITIAGAGMFYSNVLQYRYTNLCKSVSEVVSGSIDADNIDLWLNGQNTHGYVQTSNKLEKLSNDVVNLDYISIYQMRDDGMYTVYNTKATGLRRDLGAVVKYDNKWGAYKDQFLNGRIVDDVEVSGYSGITRMYCAPIFDSNDKCVAYVCSGISQATIAKEKTAFLKHLSIQLFIILGILFALMIIYIRIKIVSPIIRISEAVKNSAKKGSIEYMGNLSSLNLKASGEINSILKSSIKVFSDKTEYTNKMREDQKDVMLAFSTLIKSVNLDNVGYSDHASEYVGILAEAMSKNEKYSGILDENVCSNIVLATPLRDVGKLSIPDQILYKPGKLTYEEYQIVKGHAENGAKIIEETAKDLPDAEHLELAKEIALAHHERWDGKGYPNGLMGEEIPLAARIVAVADVFNALVTKRCYNDAFSVDDAYKIITEESGKQFDPDIIDVFVEVKEKISEQCAKINKG